MVRIVIEVPDQYKELAQALEETVKVVVKLGLRHDGGKAIDYAKVESSVSEAAAKVERTAHAGLLAGLDVDAKRVVIGGEVYTRVGRCNGSYHTMAGTIHVQRSLYRQNGIRNAKVVDAISLRAGVVADGWLPMTARAMAFDVQQVTSREAAARALQSGRLAYSRSSYERVAHAVGELYGERNVEIDDALIADYEPPEEARSVSVGLDRVSLPTIELIPRPQGRPKKGAAKRPLAVVWKMMWVATVTLHDKDGTALHTIRYGAMPDDGSESLLHSAAGDVNELLIKKPRLKVCLLSDGAHDLVASLREQVGTRVEPNVWGGRVHQGVDFWHLIEKLGAASKLLEGEHEKRINRWRMRLLNVEGAAIDILAELRASGREHVRIGDTTPVHDAITYVDNHRDHMNYAALRAAGLPIGSGNTEATCKTLVEVRAKRAGSRWNPDTCRHIIQLRALATSDRWDQAMVLTMKPLRKAVRSAA